MALTADQQAQLDYETARLALNNAEQDKQRKLDAVRMAQAIINENRRLTAASEASDVTVSQITAMADEIVSYVNS